MLGIMLQKMRAKKWMFFCLFLGSMLLTATAVSFPLYRNAAFDGMLRHMFQSSYVETGEWPAVLRRTFVSLKDDPEGAIAETERGMADLVSRVGLSVRESAAFYQLTQWGLHSAMGRTDLRINDLRLGSMSGLAEHVTLAAGEMFSESGVAQDGSIEVLISRSCMVNSNLLLGETLEFNSLKDAAGNPMRLKIVGIFGENEEDVYWEIGADKLRNACLMREDLFREYFMDGWMRHNITCRYALSLEYGGLRTSQADMLLAAIEAEGYQADTCRSILAEYTENRTRISATLFILQVPVLVLLGAFLLMVTEQMYELERNEISVFKSRGSSGLQIFRLYLYQSVFLAGAGALAGIPLGVVFCRILGSAGNFLEFSLRRELDVRFTEEAWLYLAAAALATVCIMARPAVRHSKVSIVGLKQTHAARNKAWWEKCFLDVICLGAGLYGYYNYSANREVLLQNVITGRSVDPLLYVCSSLFILGAGLFFLRLQPLLARMVYMAGERRFRPAACAAFLEILKNGRKQHFVMLFLILTIALGVFHATVARTILQNALENMSYLDGADVIIREVWTDNSARAAFLEEDTGAQADFFYYEPDYQKYGTLQEAQGFTKVLYDDPGDRKTHSYFTYQGKTADITLMGIFTKEFGENTWVDRGLLEKHYYEYLNLMAGDADAVLVSRCFQEQLGCEVGQYISYHYDTTVGSGDIARTYRYSLMGKIVGFVDYWPGFKPVGMYVNAAGNVVVYDNYLVVANMAALQRAFGTHTQPYEVWVSLRENGEPADGSGDGSPAAAYGSAAVAQWLRENGVKVEKYVDRRQDLQDVLEDPLLQGTNGVLTMSFLVMLLLCGAGYLIYWVMSIRSRELVFGVLRAMGMHKGELFGMLVLEQLFTGVLSIPAGIGIGRLASGMYVPMLQTAYAAANQVLPMRLYTDPADMLRLYAALALMFTLCLAALVGIVFRLNVVKALKLGEE